MGPSLQWLLLKRSNLLSRIQTALWQLHGMETPLSKKALEVDGASASALAVR
jgi:hypothetical protein